MAFWSRFPYTDDHQLNLDWVIKEIQKIRAASGITYDDDQTELGADNVQTAIEKLNDLIAQVAQMSSAFNLIDNAIAPTRWENGYTYSHLQTVNDPTLMAICNAVKGNKLVVLKITSGSDAEYFYEEAITEIPGDYQHIVYLYDPFTHTRLALVINGLNDAQNIFCQILAADTKTMVNAFNGRDGNVSPEAGDYAAEQVSFFNPGFTATDVKGAIKEVNNKIPASVVNSFNNRNGVVVPQTSDYNAQQIDYDSSVSGIAATNVQAAIDRVITMIFASGVASFNSRVGVVLPQAHDYDGSMIDYDNTDSGLTATNVQDAIDELAGGGMVTITLTLNGAKEDSITIYDALNTQVGTCIFASGQTQGTCQIDVPEGGGSYKFVSGVAKDTTTGTSDFEKTVTLTDTLSQTVDVMPDDVLYWFGNFVACTTFDRASDETITRNTTDSRLTVNTNNVTCVTDNSQMNGIGLLSNNAINGNGKTLKALMSQTAQVDCGVYFGQTSSDTSWSADTNFGSLNTAIPESIQSASLQNYTDFLALRLYCGGYNLAGCVAVFKSLWIE